MAEERREGALNQIRLLVTGKRKVGNGKRAANGARKSPTNEAPNEVIPSLKKNAYSPKASRMVLASRICCWTQVEMLAVTEQRYSRMNLVDSVLPAPDSPEITRLWKNGSLVSNMVLSSTSYA